MDTAELARLKALADAATPGPWKRSTKSWDGDDIHTIVVNVGNGDEAEVLQEPTDFSCYPSGSFVTTSGTVANLDFAAAARTAVPALLDEVERLRNCEPDPPPLTDESLRTELRGVYDALDGAMRERDTLRAWEAEARAAMEMALHEMDHHRVGEHNSARLALRAVLARKVGP